MLKEMVRIQAELRCREELKDYKQDQEILRRELCRIIRKLQVVQVEHMITRRILALVLGKNLSPDYTRELHKIASAIVDFDPAAPSLTEALAMLEDICRA